jgi:hypothetical protein
MTIVLCNDRPELTSKNGDVYRIWYLCAPTNDDLNVYILRHGDKDIAAYVMDDLYMPPEEYFQQYLEE